MSSDSVLDSYGDPEAARESLRRIASSDLPYAEYARRALAELTDENENGSDDTGHEDEASEDADE